MSYRETYVEKMARVVTEVSQAIRDRKADDKARYTYQGINYDVLNRDERMVLIEHVSDDYILAHAEVNQRRINKWEEKGGKGERPTSLTLNTALLDRLADAVLDEELTNKNRSKAYLPEYPFLSERQFDGRRDREYSLSLAENYDTDGVNRGKPERRRRIAREERFIEKVSQAKNRKRNAQYKRDTSSGAVTSYNLFDNGGELTEPFVAAAGIVDRYHEIICS